MVIKYVYLACFSGLWLQNGCSNIENNIIEFPCGWVVHHFWCHRCILILSKKLQSESTGSFLHIRNNHSHLVKCLSMKLMFCVYCLISSELTHIKERLMAFVHDCSESLPILLWQYYYPCLWQTSRARWRLTAVLNMFSSVQMYFLLRGDE